MKKVINFLGQKFVYEGELKNELPEGYGVLKNTKGILYEGNFKDGKFNGDGIYSGPQTLKIIIYKFTYFELSDLYKRGISPDRYEDDHYRVVGKFKNNKLHGQNIQIFNSQGDFYIGQFVNGHPRKDFIWSGMIYLGEGEYYSWLDLRQSRNPADYDFKNVDKTRYKIFIEAYENQFRKHGWFPRSVSKDKIEFELKLIEWKKNLKELENVTIN